MGNQASSQGQDPEANTTHQATGSATILTNANLSANNAPVQAWLSDTKKTPFDGLITAQGGNNGGNEIVSRIDRMARAGELGEKAKDECGETES